MIESLKLPYCSECHAHYFEHIGCFCRTIGSPPLALPPAGLQQVPRPVTVIREDSHLGGVRA